MSLRRRTRGTTVLTGVAGLVLTLLAVLLDEANARTFGGAVRDLSGAAEIIGSGLAAPA